MKPYCAVLNEDGTPGEPILIKPTNMKEEDLYADSESSIDKEKRKFYDSGEWKSIREKRINPEVIEAID
ncbi:hypothetical protein COD66_23340 [Bacillus cereus]|nr:hypothetical protein COD66_23340 [Bacillus cereus]